MKTMKKYGVNYIVCYKDGDSQRNIIYRSDDYTGLLAVLSSSSTMELVTSIVRVYNRLYGENLTLCIL